jgi:hypothetical protein
MIKALVLGSVIACGDSPRETPPTVDDRLLRLEREIASELTGTFARDVKVTCTPPARCVADLGDAKLPIVLATSHDGWTWRIDGMLVRTAPIEAYLRDTVRDLGADQRISCGAPLRSVAPGDRIACSLERGGTAFVVVRADGSFGVELQIDRAAAAARSKDTAEKELLERSLAGSGANDDDDD